MKMFLSKYLLPLEYGGLFWAFGLYSPDLWLLCSYSFKGRFHRCQTSFLFWRIYILLRRTTQMKYFECMLRLCNLLAGTECMVVCSLKNAKHAKFFYFLSSFNFLFAEWKVFN